MYEEDIMFGVKDGAAANDREVTALIDRAKTLTAEEWESSVLPGWTVLDMLDHVARALVQQAEAFERGMRADLEQPEFPVPQATTPSAVLEDLVAAAAAMQRTLAKLTPESLGALTPMPFGVVPTAVALQIAVIEYGMHRWDLERVCGNAAYDLADDVAAASVAMIPGLLPMLASRSDRQPERPIAFQLASTFGAPVVEFDGTAWAAVDATDLTPTVIAGSPSDITMFYIGRLNSNSPGITVTGPARVAENFKRFFPGP
jgi:uncharacterized protein (TIGR03083 family)